MYTYVQQLGSEPQAGGIGEGGEQEKNESLQCTHCAHTPIYGCES